MKAMMASLKRWQKILLTLFLLLAALVAYGIWYFETRNAREPSRLAFQEYCASCHGTDLKGSDKAPSLIGRELSLLANHQALMAAISGQGDMAAAHDWREKLSPEMIKAVALYIGERQQAYFPTAASYTFRQQARGPMTSQHHDFAVEQLAALPSRPYGLTALPDGRLIVAEKTRGLSLIESDGQLGAPLTGTPRVWDTILSVQGAWLNLGIMLDVALHPDYQKNGWVYTSHTDRCWLDCGSIVPVTMVRVVRGRIKDNAWVDQEVIWSVHRDHYTPVPDGVAAGRLAFDKDNHLYISIGGKNTYDKLHQLDTPFGKIHRVRDDGSVPRDNPYFIEANKRAEASTRHTVWSIGHRTGQGLAGHPISGAIWNSEMGPRGGDEMNLIEGGGNYGWPLYTNGLNYNGEYISIGDDLGLDFAIEETVLPIVDFTPAPALSNLTFYQGEAFPDWNGDALIGSLKAGTLYRVRVENNAPSEVERLLVNFGRIRDIAVGPEGDVYVALEHNENGSIWRLSPR